MKKTYAEYKVMSVAALKKLCKAQGIKGYSRLLEDELIALLTGEPTPTPEPPAVVVPEPPVVVEPPAATRKKDAAVMGNKRINVVVNGRTRRLSEGSIYRGELGAALLYAHPEHVDEIE